MSKLEEIMSVSLGYNPEGKDSFKNEGVRLMRKLAKDLGLSAAERDIRFNPGGIAVSGDVILHTDHVYVHLSQSCLGMGHEVYYRKCKGRRDYTGEINFWATAGELASRKLAEKIKKLLEVPHES